MKSPSIGLFGLFCALMIGCQSKPLTWQNPFAMRKPPVDKAVSKVADDDRDNADDVKAKAKAPRTSDKRGVAAMNPIPESVDLIDDPERNAPSKAEQMWSQAEAAMQQGNLAKATAFYREVANLDPNNAAAQHRLALIATQQKNYPLAESHYLKAVNLDPQNASILNDLGYSYLEQGRLADSERIFQQLLQVDPGNSLALRNMGELKARQGDKADAFRYFRKGGLDYAAAQRKVIETASAAAETDVAARRESKPTDPGLPYSSPTPDWDSRYGVAPVASSREAAGPAANSGLQMTAESGPASQQVYGNSPIQQTAGTVQRPVAEPGTATGNGDAYALERALLNAGPGSLFPTSGSGMADGVDAASDTGQQVAPLGYKAALPNTEMNPNTATANQSASVRIQSPASGAGGYGAPANSLPLTTGGRIPATAPATDAGYQQFPGRLSTPRANSIDSLHQFEEEIQSGRSGSNSQYP